MKFSSCAAALLLAAGLAAADRQLFSIARGGAVFAPFNKTDKVKVAGDRLALELPPKGGRWQGTIVTPKKGEKYFDLSQGAILAVDVRNNNKYPMQLRMEIVNLKEGKNSNAFAHIAYSSIALLPGEKAPLRVRYGRAVKESSAWAPEGMQRLPDGFVKGDHKIVPDRVAQLRIWTSNPDADRPMRFELSNFRVEEPVKPLPEALRSKEAFYPFIDRFGQYKHADWPGKVTDVAQLGERKLAEDRELAANPAVPGRNRFGGWADGPTFGEKKGGWGTVKYKGKWFLTDPEGKLFWSLGMNTTHDKADSVTAITFRENYFEELPENSAENADFYTKERFPRFGFYKGKGGNQDTNILQFHFYCYNMFRKYGKEYHKEFVTRSQRRFSSWGFNTNGNWVHPDILKTEFHHPYITAVEFAKFYDVIEGCRQIGWQKFPDVFNPEFAAGIKEALQTRQKYTVDDPFCIGYFIDNELSWGKTDTFLAEGALRSPASQPAKIAMTEYYRNKYGNDIAALNKVWGTGYADFGAFLNSTAMPAEPEKARADLEEFNDVIVNRYFRTCKEVINREAPGKLYFGCRFNDRNEKVIATSAKYLDGCSFNLYRPEISAWRLPAGVDMPVIVGEWHYGTAANGPAHPGLQPAANQAERARGFDRYVRSALWNPQIAGVHYFKYTDQMATGRPADDENIQCGFVDVTDTPYREMVDAARKVSADMYRYRLAEGPGK